MPPMSPEEGRRLLMATQYDDPFSMLELHGKIVIRPGLDRIPLGCHTDSQKKKSDFSIFSLAIRSSHETFHEINRAATQ